MGRSAMGSNERKAQLLTIMRTHTATGQRVWESSVGQPSHKRRA